MASSLKNRARIWMIKARKLLVALAIWIGVFICLRVGGFSQIQSITLILLFNLYLAALAYAKSNPLPAFEPFVIEVGVYWKSMLADHGLLDEDKWKVVMEAAEPNDGNGQRAHGERRKLRPQMFTALGSSLYYSHKHSSFGTKLQDRVDLCSVCLDSVTDDVFDLPAFYLREKHDPEAKTAELGQILEFGLKVRNGGGTEELPLANLPKAILDRARVTTNIDATLQKSGWKREWIGGDDPDLEEEDVIEVITHKYLRVSLQGA